MATDMPCTNKSALAEALIGEGFSSLVTLVRNINVLLSTVFKDQSYAFNAQKNCATKFYSEAHFAERNLKASNLHASNLPSLQSKANVKVGFT
ncbi:hypothetical protein GDO86_012585 [Hymenochirus boettgeri]|uniref:Uncharacterized protein n=1 Tax=Hymenochirus boettgeri TaxID=247094 RepID=A0A8T2IQK5_9PIPI|nr:hypothetical protein GDO86_012585 [Hymenochirus boettgeri]